MSNETNYLADPRANPPTWSGSRDLQGILYRRTVIRTGVTVVGVTKVVSADINRMGVYIRNTSGATTCFLGHDNTVGTTVATGWPLAVASSRFVWIPTSADIWANSGGLNLDIIEVFFT